MTDEREHAAVIAENFATGPFTYEARVMAGAIAAAIREGGRSGMALVSEIDGLRTRLAAAESVCALVAGDVDAVCVRVARGDKDDCIETGRKVLCASCTFAAALTAWRESRGEG